MSRTGSTNTLRKELVCCLVLVCSISHAAGQVTCRASFNCNGGPDDDLGVAASGESCCLDNPSALAYVPVGSEDCFPCVVVGFINASFSGVEQGPGHSVPVGYLKGGTIAGQNLVFDVTSTPGTARHFDYSGGNGRVWALANGRIANVVLSFRVDNVALEPNETFTLTLYPVITPTPREGLFFRDTIEVTIIDSDNVEFSFTEDDFRAFEEGRNGSHSIMPIVVSKSTRIASWVELVIVPLTVQEARDTSIPLPPNVPTDNPRSPPFASLNDFNNTNITLIFEPDEDAEINEKSAPVYVIDDAINEATEQVFVAELILINSTNAASVTLTRPSTLCRILDNDPIRVGFELPGYTYTEPALDKVVDQFFVSATGRPENGPIYLIKEGNVTSEQTFLVSVQVTDSAPSGIQSATFGQDYRVPAHNHSILFNAFEQRIPFALTLLADTLPEGNEAFQLSVSTKDTGDIGGGMEQFPTSLNPITLASEVFITIDVTELITIGFADASYTVNESVGTFQVDVQVFNPTDDQPLPPSVDLVIQTVSGTATGGSDYQEIKASQLDVLLTFDNNNRRQSFSVAITDDQLVEGTESFTLQLRFDPFLIPRGSNILLSPNVSVVTVLDDDDPATTVSPPSLPPPIGVQGLCSVVVWYSPAVSCEDIRGYEVRLYHPQSSHLNMTSFVGANGTFYMVDEEKLVSSDETFIQVRAIYQTGVGEWSEGSSLGCEKPTAPEKPPTVHFELNGKVYLNNSAIAISEIGEGTNALYCRTDKEECCGVVPNRFGQFYYPSGVQIPIANQQQGFYRNRGDQIIRLNRREGITSPTGTYRCEIPNADDETVRIYITLTGN